MEVFHVKDLPTEDILPLIKNKENSLRNNENKINIQGFDVYIESVRLYTFKTKGCECTSCGRIGSHFRIKEKGSTFELGLWSNDNVQMTKDHIIPSILGGFDTVDNMQTMCTNCNQDKGSNINKSDFDIGKGLYSYEEALKIYEHRQDKKIMNFKYSKEEEKSKNDKILKKYPNFENIKEKIREIRKNKIDPFINIKDPDIIYMLSYLSDVIKEYKGIISSRNKVLRPLPAKFIQEEVNRYIVYSN